MIEVREGVRGAAIDGLDAVAGGHKTLEEVVRWGLGHEPPRMIEGVLAQDEYTLDVVLRYADGVYLVYDTT